MDDKILSIKQKLEKLKESKKKEEDKISSNREAAIKLARFVSDTITDISPELRATWVGSHSNPDVAEYPVVTISAEIRHTNETLAKWVIDASGKMPPPNVTREHIIGQINKAVMQIAEGKKIE